MKTVIRAFAVAVAFGLAGNAYAARTSPDKPAQTVEIPPPKCEDFEHVPYPVRCA